LSRKREKTSGQAMYAEKLKRQERYDVTIQRWVVAFFCPVSLEKI